MAKQETVTVYFGTDPYIINKADMDSFIAQGFTKKAKAATSSTDNTNTANTTGAATTGAAASTAATAGK